MIPNTIIYSIASILLLLTLYFSSKEDIRYHRISKKYVLICIIIVYIYNILVPGDIEKLLSLLFTFGLFSMITVLSRGGFGFGDTIILGMLGWFIGDMIMLSYFFIVLGFCMLILESYFVYKNRNNGNGWRGLFPKNKMIQVKDLRPGMILHNDYFMKGLTEKEIEDIRKTCDTTICIKQAYPFIPVIFISFLLYVFVSLNI